MTADPLRYDSVMTMRAASPLKRLSRPDAPPSFHITERDFAILWFVAQVRCATSDQIARRVGGSPRGVRSRLKHLFRAAYLDRPQHQNISLAAFFDEGNRPLVYALARKGARLLAERGAPIDHRLDWHTKNRRATAPFLAHTVEVAEAMLAFHFPTFPYAPRLVDHHELLPMMPEAARSHRDPFKLSVDIKHHGRMLTLAVVPDRLFALTLNDGRRWNFALELDRGTMDINAKRIVGKSSFRKKLIGYYHAWLEKKHTQAWGFRSFRVLTITPSEKRLGNMLKAQREVTNDRAAGLFLYTTPERIAEFGPFGPAWVSSSADRISLLPSASTTAETTDA